MVVKKFVFVIILMMLVSCTIRVEPAAQITKNEVTPSAAVSEPTKDKSQPTPTGTSTTVPTSTHTVTPEPTVTPTPDPKVITWENADQLVELARIGEGEVVKAVMSHSGNEMIVATSLGIRVIDLREFKEIGNIKLNASPVDIAISSDDQLLAVALNNDRAHIYNLSSLEFVGRVNYRYGVHSVAFSPDGKTAAGVGFITIKLFDQNGRVKRQIENTEESEQQVLFSPEGDYIITRAYEGDVIAWDLPFLKLKKRITSVKPVMDLTADGKYILMMDTWYLYLYDPVNLRLVRSYPLTDLSFRFMQGVSRDLHFIKPINFSLSKDEQTLAISNAMGIHLYRYPNISFKGFLPAEDQILSMFLSHDGASVYTVDKAGFVRQRDIENGEILRELRYGMGEVYGVYPSLNDNNELLVKSDVGGAIGIYHINTRDGTFIGQRFIEDIYPLFASVRFTTENNWIVIPSSSSLEFLPSLQAEKPAFTLIDVVQGCPYGILVNPAVTENGEYAAIKCWGNQIQIWDLNNKQVIHELSEDRPCQKLQFLAGGPLLSANCYAGYDQHFVVWEASSGNVLIDQKLKDRSDLKTLIETLSGSPFPELQFLGDIFSLMGRSSENILYYLDWELLNGLSPDRKLIAIGSSPRNFRICNLEKISQCHTITAHNSTVYSVAFSRDGTLLFSGSEDGTVRIWGIP
jgi:WD40 repeat protein